MNDMQVIKVKFPHLYECLESGMIVLYDSHGYTRELSDEHKAIIQQLENESKTYNLKVICVLDGTYNLGGEHVQMTSYVYTIDDFEPFELDDGSYSFYAYVDNPAWGVQEHGTIGIKETVGLLKRTY